MWRERARERETDLVDCRRYFSNGEELLKAFAGEITNTNGFGEP